MSGTMSTENESGPGAIGVAPDLTSTCLGGADMSDRTCSVKGCDNKHKAQGWCSKHYQRWLKYGDPLGTKPRPTLEDRLWSRVKPAGDCWLWTGSTSWDGYGAISVMGKPRRAHRVAYELLVGPIPDGLVIDHLCRTPACVNPSHLEPVTDGENIRRGFGRAGINVRKTHCVRGHEFTDENTYIYPGTGRRACNECRRMRNAPRRAA